MVDGGAWRGGGGRGGTAEAGVEWELELLAICPQMERMEQIDMPTFCLEILAPAAATQDSSLWLRMTIWTIAIAVA